MRLRTAILVAGLLMSCAPMELDRSSGPLQTPTPTVAPSGSPAPGQPLRFAVIGDFGTGWPIQHQVARRMCKWRERHPFDLVITTGDNIYPDGAPEHFQEKFFDPYRCLFEGGVEFHASLGNHDFLTDRGRPEIEEPAFGMPKRNYVLRINGVRFVVADSNTLEREWLSDALKARPLDRWTIPVFHFPVYSPGTQRGSTPGYRPDLPRLFRRRDVDLVLNGHDHLYAVTKPLRKIRYVVTGGGGGGLYPCGEAWFSARCQSRYHFLYVVARANEIAIRAVPVEGKPFHRFVTTGRI
ncbi:MAG: metallophosphoesterase [Actinomycetota bacterium]|nr:metallophosphoesterase [Actinomycetota bacterium]